MWERYKMDIFDAREKTIGKPLWTYILRIGGLISFIATVVWLLLLGFNVLQIALLLFGVILFVIGSKAKERIEYEKMPLEITFYNDRVSFYWSSYNPTDDGFEQTCCNTFLFTNITNIFLKENAIEVHGNADFDIVKDDGLQKYYVKEYRKNIGIEIKLNFVDVDDLLTTFDQYIPVKIEKI